MSVWTILCTLMECREVAYASQVLSEFSMHVWILHTATHPSKKEQLRIKYEQTDGQTGCNQFIRQFKPLHSEVNVRVSTTKML